MRIENDRISGSSFIFSTINEWRQLRGGYNWTNWNWVLVQAAYENDIIMGGYELQVILLGLGLRVRWNKPIKTKEMLRIDEQMKEYDACAAAGVEVPGSRDWKDVKAELMEGRCPRCWYKIDESEKEEELKENT